jgi:hypothetical protein
VTFLQNLGEVPLTVINTFRSPERVDFDSVHVVLCFFSGGGGGVAGKGGQSVRQLELCFFPF